VVFTAHSLPMAQAQASGRDGGAYVAQLRATAERVMAAAADGGASWQLAFQSRSGSPSQPWLEPDILDVLGELAEAGTRDVVVAPIGFVSDHMEVRYDLDVAASARATQLGMRMSRAGTVGTDPRFVSMIAEMVADRQDPVHTRRRTVNPAGPTWDACAASCCLSAGATPRPAVAGVPAQTHGAAPASP
jgi:ferrochelatase